MNESRFKSHSSIENIYINQTVESDPVNTTNVMPTSVGDEDLENIECNDKDSEEGESTILPGLLKLFDERLLSILESDDLTYGEMEKLISKKIDKIMTNKFGKYFQFKIESFIQINENIWCKKYEALDNLLQTYEATRKLEENLEAFKDIVPQQLRKHVKIQTGRTKNMDPATSSGIKNQKHFCARTLQPSTSNRITNQKRLCASIQQCPTQAQLKKTSKVSGVTAREKRAKPTDILSFEIIDLSSAESSEESEINNLYRLHGITNQKRQ